MIDVFYTFFLIFRFFLTFRFLTDFSVQIFILTFAVGMDDCSSIDDCWGLVPQGCVTRSAATGVDKPTAPSTALPVPRWETSGSWLIGAADLSGIDSPFGGPFFKSDL